MLTNLTSMPTIICRTFRPHMFSPRIIRDIRGPVVTIPASSRDHMLYIRVVSRSIRIITEVDLAAHVLHCQARSTFLLFDLDKSAEAIQSGCPRGHVPERPEYHQHRRSLADRLLQVTHYDTDLSLVFPMAISSIQPDNSGFLR